MSRHFRVALSAAFVVLLGALTGARSQDPAPPAASGEGLPDGPGKDVMVRVCGVCHEPRRAASVRLTRDGWQALIEDMVKRGAKASEDDQRVLLEYLAANFLGEAPRPLNINTAAAIDFESVIGLLRREAAAVIAYRDANGPFKTVDDLKKVPGLDFKKIDGNRDRIVCF